MLYIPIIIKLHAQNSWPGQRNIKQDQSIPDHEKL